MQPTWADTEEVAVERTLVGVRWQSLRVKEELMRMTIASERRRLVPAGATGSESESGAAF
jgi:hypothetical protein